MLKVTSGCVPLVLALLSVGSAPVRAAGPQSAEAAPATIRAKGRGGPFLFLRDGRKVPTNYIGDTASSRSFATSSAKPLSLASADFDEDGVPDLVSGYAASDGSGAVTLHRGNVDALWPYGAAVRNGEPPAFLPQARVFTLPEAPDFLGAGDFDADGHWDIVAVRLGSIALYLLRGDGRGGFAEPERIELPGPVTAFTTGEINRVDGLTDIAVGVAGLGGPQVLVFESPRGALRDKPEIFPVPAAAHALAMMPLDGDHFNGLAIGAGNQLLAIHGRDRKLSHPKAVRDGVAAAEITRQTLPFAVRSLAAGRFTTTASHVLDLAALGDDGKVHVLERADADYQAALAQLPVSLGGRDGLPAPGRRGKLDVRPLPKRPESRELVLRDEVALPSLPSAAARLVTALASITGADDAVLADSSAAYLHVISRNPADRSMRLAASLETASGGPAAVLPMRLNRSALHGLVVLQHGQIEPSVAPALVQSIYTVTNTQDPGASQFNTQNTSIPGSLRWAISSAIDAGGTSIIDFNIPVTDPNYDPNKGTFTITPLPNTNCGAGLGVPCQGLPPLPPGCVIDAYTQPGGILNGITQPPASPNTLANGDNAVVKIVISGAVAGQGPDGIWLFNGMGTVRGLIVNGFNSALNPGGLTTTGGFGINADSGGNFIEGNFLGVDSTGTVGVPNYVGTGGFGGPNTVGGTTPQARNLVAANTYSNFGSAVDSSPNTYFVQGNYVGTDRTGTQALSPFHGGLVENGAAMVIGGTAAGAGNLASGNNTGISINYPAGNSFTPDSNIVQGNLIGTDPTGKVAAGNAVGMYVDTGKNNLIGGSTSAARNVIAGNSSDGIDLQNAAQNTTVQGNYIGVDVTGAAALSNGGTGINNATSGNVANAFDTVVGGESPGAGNVISANGFSGILFGGAAGPLAATVLGNRIGTDATATHAMGNVGAGISILGGASSIAVGSTDTPAGNVIAFNGQQGVVIDPANQLQLGQSVGGSDAVIGNAIYSNSAAGVAIVSGTANRVSQNSIYSNTGLGIDVDATGHLVNSNCQTSTNGGNSLQNAPVLTAANGGSTVPISATATDPNGNTSEFSNCAAMALNGSTVNIVGTLNSLKNTTYSIEFFQNTACDASGFGQGKTFLNRIPVTTDNNCNASFGDNANVTTADVGISLGYDHNLYSTFVTPDQVFAYQATITNNGPGPATNVSFSQTLPAGESLVSISKTQGTCSGTVTLTCAVGSLASGATAQITVNVTITNVGSIANTATVSTTTPDPTPANNSSTLTLNSQYSGAFIDHLSPASGVAGTGPLALTIYGFTFYPNATTTVTATLNGNIITLPYVLQNNLQCGSVFQPETCQGLQVTIPNSMTANPGTVTIGVSNPAGNSFGPDTRDLIIYPSPGTVTHFQLSGVPNPALQNTNYNLTVKAVDANGIVVPGYRGTVTLADLYQSDETFDPASPYTFTAADNGVHTFSTAFSFTGDDTITVTDVGTPSVTTSQNLTINPLLGPPNRLIPSSTPDSVPIGFPFPQPLTVTVTDASGNLLPGISVTLTVVPQAGAGGTFSKGQGTITLITDSNGSVSAVLTANQTAGQFQVNATVSSLVVQWFPTSTPNVPAHLTIVDGNPQSGPINTDFAGLLDVMVTDAQGNPVKSVPVTFSAPSSGASVNLASTTAVTAQFSQGFVKAGTARLDPIGVANATAGSYKVTATVGSLSIQFDFTNTPTPSVVASMDALGTPQLAAINTQFALKLGAKPRDNNGNCIAQVPVTFSAPANGASATLTASPVLSDPITCIAQVTATANGTAGSYNVTATAPGGVTATYALTNTPGAITVTATGGTPQSTPILKSFLYPLQATLVDAGGNPMSGQTINFTAPASGASAVLSPASATTDSSGNATVFATANGTLGSYSVMASFGSSKATFQLTNVPPPAELSIQKTHSGSFSAGQSHATYTITVSNSASAGPTDGSVVTVTDYVPSGLTLVSMAGTGWSCPSGNACTRSNPLAAGASYPPITVTVNVATGFTSVTNQAGVSGGGSNPANASDLTTFSLSPCDINKDASVDALDVRAMIDEALGKKQAADDLNHDGKANAVDAQIVINAAKSLGCSVQ